MKPAGIRYVTLLGIFLLASALAWTSLLEARGTNVSTSRLMTSARLFEQQGRVLKAAELYRKVLRVAPGHKAATYRLAGLRANAAEMLRSTEPEITTPAATITPVNAVKTVKVLEPVAVAKPVTPIAAVTKKRSKSIPVRISDAVAKLKPTRRKLTDRDVASGSNQLAEDEATRSKEPKPVLVKTRKALADAGTRVRSLVPKRRVDRPGTVKPAPEVTPVTTAKPAGVVTPQAVLATAPKKQKRSIRDRISDAVAKLRPWLKKTTNRDGDTGSNQEAGDESTRTKEPKQALAKTRKALVEAGTRVRSLAPSRRVVRPGTAKPVEAVTPAQEVTPDKTAKPVEVVTPEPVLATPPKKTMSIRDRISDAVAKLKPRLQKTSNRDVATGSNQEAGGESTRPTEPPLLLSRTRKAIAEFRSKFRTSLPKRTATRERPQLETSIPSKPRISGSLRPSLPGESNRGVADVADPAAATPRSIVAADPVAISRTPEKVRIAESKGPQPQPKTVSILEKPLESRRPVEIPQLSTSERIVSASKILMANPDDEPARRVLIEAVMFAPDVEASLAAYMLGTRGSGYQDVMTALGEQLSARTGVARVHMGEAMLRLDGNHVTATDSLIGMVSSSDPQIRMMAAFAMQAASDIQRDRCISTLIKVLQDKDSDVRAAAALALGGYGPAARAALPAIVRLVHDENVDTARAAGAALQCIAPPPATAQPETTVRPVTAEAVIGQ